MAVRKRNHPDRDECINRLAKIDKLIPEKYGTRAREILIEKGVSEMPTQRQIFNIRNGRIYDLEVIEALEQVAEEAEAKKKKEEKLKKGQGPLFKQPLNS